MLSMKDVLCHSLRGRLAENATLPLFKCDAHVSRAIKLGCGDGELLSPRRDLIAACQPPQKLTKAPDRAARPHPGNLTGWRPDGFDAVSAALR
jgi:hypothetical protein